MDPFTNAWHSYPTGAVFGFLVGLSPDYKEWIGWLAESWTISEDNLVVTFKLKPGLTFTDGSPINSEAIKWNIDRHMDETIASPAGGDLRANLDFFEVIDDLTFAYHLKNPMAAFFVWIGSMEICSPTAYELYGPDNYSMHLTAAGPWIVSEVVPENYIHYVVNPDFNWEPTNYYDNTGPVNIPEYEIRFMSDPEVIYASLETGEITIAGIPTAYLEQARANPDITIVEGVETTLHYLGMNNQYEQLADINVRQAIAYAMNRQEIIDGAYDGFGIPSYAGLTPAMIGFSQADEDYSKQTSDDPAMAMQILEDNGWTMNADGVYAKAGVPLEFSIMVEPSQVMQRAAEIVQAQLADVGIKLNIAITENTAIREATVNGTHQFIWWTYGLIDPSIYTYIFNSNRMGASNRNRVVDPTLDAMLNTADQTLDPAVRMPLVSEITRYLADKRYHIPLFTLTSYTGYRNDQIEGLKFTPDGGWIEIDAHLLP